VENEVKFFITVIFYTHKFDFDRFLILIALKMYISVGGHKCRKGKNVVKRVKEFKLLVPDTGRAWMGGKSTPGGARRSPLFLE